MTYLTNLCSSDVELRKCCGRCFGAVPALRRRESVGFAFLRSDERLYEVGGALYLQQGKIFFNDEILRCRENCITLQLILPPQKEQQKSSTKSFHIRTICDRSCEFLINQETYITPVRKRRD